MIPKIIHQSYKDWDSKPHFFNKSPELIKELMPDFEYTPFEQGIKETVNWFIENYENARK